MNKYFDKNYVCLKPFLNGLSLFLGILFLGLMSCSTAADSTSSNPTEDKTPPTVIISTNESLEIDKTGNITFTFSEKVNNFTPDDIQFITNGTNGVSADKGKLVTNNLTNYSLEITPKAIGTLYLTIPDKSFEDLSGNQNTNSFSVNFSVEDKNPPTVTISTNKSLEIDITGTITFTFSEKVNNFTPDDIQFITNGTNGVSADKGKLVTNNLTNYSLEITPKAIGTLYLTIPDKSFEDLSGNQNTNSFSVNFSVEDKNPPTVTISTNKSLEIDITGTITFTFSEKVNNFTPDDIQFITNGTNGVTANKGKLVTNNLRNYSLEITPKAIGTLYVTIPDKSFEDLSGNQSTKEYTSNFEVYPSSYTISFKLNGGSFISPQVTTLKVFSNTAIEQARLGGILSYPPTGPQSNIQAVTRDIFEWRTNGIKYELSTPVTNDLTLEAIWSNSCGKIETFHPANKNELSSYVNVSVASKANTNLNHIDTSAITDMNTLFYKSSFNGKIDCWNTAMVTDMNTMFNSASNFNQDIGNWNVSNVSSIWNMFNDADVFNQDIGSWNVANVNNMSYMFLNASVFNQDIGSWDVGNVTTMNNMFQNTSNFNQDISSWDVSRVNNMSTMFWNANNFNQDISSWDVSRVNSMRSMFNDASSFNQDISSWDVSRVNNMSSMFNGAKAFNQNLSKWSVSNVTSYYDMFTGSAMASKTNQHPRFSSSP